MRGEEAGHHPHRGIGGVPSGGDAGTSGTKSREGYAPPRAPRLAHYWQRLLDNGIIGSLTEIAADEGMDLGQVSRIARLARLTPWVVEACLACDETVFTLEQSTGGRHRWIGATSLIGFLMVKPKAPSCMGTIWRHKPLAVAMMAAPTKSMVSSP